MIRIIAMYLAIASGVLAVTLVWDATRSPMICAAPGWEVVGYHHWTDRHGRQCAFTREVDDSGLRWIHPEEWEWQR